MHAISMYIVHFTLNPCLKLVLFESLRNCKRRNKGNFTSKSNLRFQRYNFFQVSVQFLVELNNIFQVKGLKIVTSKIN